MAMSYLQCVVLALALQQVYGSYWEMPWSATHDRPVFRIEPQIKWTFTHSSQQLTWGKVTINDDTGDILLPNGNTDREGPLFFIIDKHGKEVMSWNATESPQARCSGTITHRRGVVYVFSDVTCELFAVSVASGEQLWSNTQLCPEDRTSYNWMSITPITWLKNDTVMLLVTSRRVITVRASDGEVLMSHGPVTDYTTQMPPISSGIDNKFIFHTSNSTVFTLDVETGEVEWSTQLTLGNFGYSGLPPPPAVDTDGAIYVPTYGGLVHKVLANGTKAWSTDPVSGLQGIRSSPVLVNSSHIMVAAGYKFLNLFLVSKSDGVVSQVYTGPERESGEFKSQLYWNSNVLYSVISYEEIAAWDTTDLSNVTRLWSVDLQQQFARIEGSSSIMKDGTIVIAAGENYSELPSASLVAIGCPDGASLSSDGRQCLCDAGKAYTDGTCTQCPSNRVSNGVTCQTCQAGTVPNDDQSACSSCPANTFSREGDVTCSPCSDDPSNDQCAVAPTESPTSKITSSAHTLLAGFISALVAAVFTL